MDTHGIRDLCFYSSCAVFGDSKPPLREDSPTAPNSPYGASKLAGEKVVKPWADKGDNRRALVIRPTITFGPRNFANMYSLIRQIHSGKYAQIGPGTNIKSLSYVENIVSATNFLWMRPESQRAPFDIFNYIDKPDLTSRRSPRPSTPRSAASSPPSPSPWGWACCSPSPSTSSSSSPARTSPSPPRA
jgi:nucleoside-diphosphate-sugar epimerase